MGLKNALTIFENIYDKEKSKIPKLSGPASSNNIFTYTLRTDEVAQQLSESAIKALTPFRNNVSPAIYNIITSTQYCKISAEEVINGMKRAARPATLPQGSFAFLGTNPFAMPLWASFRGAPGVYRLGRTLGGRGISVRFVSGPGGGNNPKVNEFNLQVRNMLWAHWSNRTGRIYGVTSKSAGKKATGAEMQVAHERDTTIGAMILKSLRENRPTMTIRGVMTVSEIVDQIESNLGIDLDRNYEVTKKGFSFKWNIFASMRKNYAGSEDTDMSRIKNSRRYGPGKAEEAIYQIYERKFGSFWAKLWRLRGSTPPKDQAIGGHAADLIDGIVRPLTRAGRPDMRFKVNKTAKNFKGTKDKGTIKKPTNRKPKTTTKIITQTIIGKTARPQKERRKGVQEMVRLQALINKRLPAQVRRNMGKPALTNRSGTFSNSPEILKLSRTKTGLTADYTYMKTGGGTPPRTNQPGVYQTFESSGRWPVGYNPKDLIKKSIRELAVQYTDEKFVQLRRR